MARATTTRAARVVAASVAEHLLSDAVTRLLAVAGDRATARLEAELLLAHVLGVERLALLSRDVLDDGAAQRFSTLVDRRARTAEPIAHLIGRRGFWDIDLVSDGRALVPRPETELLVERCEALIEQGGLPTGPIIDWGTGTGALALVLARHRPVVALDRMEAALSLAATNRARIPTAQRVWLLASRGMGCLRPGSAALIVANPPYVTPAEWAELMPDVREHDPHSALVPEHGDVLDLYVELGAEAARVLVPGGRLLVEIGAGQADELEHGLASAGLEPAGRHRDLAGIERVLELRRAV